MMDALYSWIAALILFFIGATHVYWAFGGTRWIDVALPKIEGSQMRPGRGLTLLVAAALFFAGLVSLALSHIIQLPLSAQWLQWCGIAWASIFLLRGLGGLIVIAFLGYLKDTPFGKMDTQLYSPLCLFLSGAFFLLVS